MDGTIRVKTAVWFATAVVVSVFATLLVSQEWRADAAPGDSDSTFVPTAGCRVTDTRGTSTVGPRNTPLGANQTFKVAIHGSNGECTGALLIPADAVAVALNVTAVNATASSNIRIFPANLTTVPLLSNLNVSAGAPPTPNKVDVKLSPDGKIKVYNFNGSVNIVIDIVGYYTKSTLKELATRVAASEAKIAVLEASEPSTGLPPVGFFTATQIVRDAILTCNSVTDSGLTCNGPKLNNSPVSANGGGASLICLTIFGTEESDLHPDGGSGKAEAYAWNGSDWFIDTAAALHIIDFSCDPMVP
jgi:hypothetical protein